MTLMLSQNSGNARLIMPPNHFAALTVINFLSFAIDYPDEFLESWAGSLHGAFWNAQYMQYFE